VNDLSTQGNGVYVYNSKYVYVAPTQSSRSFAKTGDTSAVNYLIPASNAFFDSASSAAKEYPLRGTTLLIPNGTLSYSSNCYQIAEVDLYGYNTTTTFWVPPQIAGGGQTAYIYAGA